MTTRILIVLWALLLAPHTPSYAQEATAFFGPSEDDAARSMVIHSSGDIDFFAPVLRGFTDAHPGLRVIYEQRAANEIYALAAKACENGEASADVVISSAIDQQIKLVNDGCARPHTSSETLRAPKWANWRNEIFGMTREPVVIVYNKLFIPGGEEPLSRFDLIDILRPTDSKYIGRIATYDIEASGVGYLFAFADSQQATTFGRLIEAFGRNGVAMSSSSNDLIKGVATGEYLLAYNILGSYAAAWASHDERIGVIAPQDYTLMLSRAAVLMRGAAALTAGEEFIDFVLSGGGQKLLREASLIVDPTTDPRFGGAAPNPVSASALRPIAYSPALLVGLDRQKKRLFLERWRKGVYAARKEAR